MFKTSEEWNPGCCPGDAAGTAQAAEETSSDRIAPKKMGFIMVASFLLKGATRREVPSSSLILRAISSRGL
jgi:hypothetical protein